MKYTVTVTSRSMFSFTKQESLKESVILDHPVQIHGNTSAQVITHPVASERADTGHAHFIYEILSSRAGSLRRSLAFSHFFQAVLSFFDPSFFSRHLFAGEARSPWPLGHPSDRRLLFSILILHQISTARKGGGRHRRDPAPTARNFRRFPNRRPRNRLNYPPE